VTAARAKTIAFYSGSGGVGKTLIATSLAAGYQQQENGRVLIIDGGVPMPGDTVTAIGLERAKALADMAPILGRQTPESFSTYLVTAPSGVAVMPIVGDVLQTRLVTPELLNLMFDLAAAAYDLIVIDMPAGVGPITPSLFERTDEVIIVSDATTTGVVRARHAVEYLRSLQFPTEALLYCVNRMPERSALTTEKLERIVGLPVAVTRRRRAARRSFCRTRAMRFRAPSIGWDGRWPRGACARARRGPGSSVRRAKRSRRRTFES
jgi:pilus assembly protein CpaE